MITRGAETFARDRKVFEWLQAQRCCILPLPKPFMAQRLHTTMSHRSGVEPDHYRQLIEMVVRSATLDEFITKSKEPQSAWKEIDRLDSVHTAQLDKELAVLATLAKASIAANISRTLSNSFGVPGCRPKPIIIERTFSAALEFLTSSLIDVRDGAKPWKNDRGLYVDFQLFFYLADPEIFFVTKEDFSRKIQKSPQRHRIVRPEYLH